jgi:hypothetical protein
MNPSFRKTKPRKASSGNLGRYLVWAILPTLLIVRGLSKPLFERIQLSNYQAPPEVSELATQANMTDEGRRAFYLNTPTVEVQKDGLNLCASHDNKNTIVLGCYVSGKGIYIQKVTDQRLAGTMQVTAAHEMLHAIYHNHLSFQERSEIDQELKRVFANLNNPRLKSLIQIYRDRSPGQVSSELHSFLGTEVAQLSPKLEQHYAKYLSNRSTLVALAQKNELLFVGIEDKAGGIKKQIQVLKAQIDNREKTISDLLSAMRSSSVVSVDQQRLYNSHVEVIKQETDYYNQLVDTYNGLSSEGRSLTNSLGNSSPTVQEQ